MRRERRNPIRGVSNTIFGGFAGGKVLSLAKNKHVKSFRTTHSIQKRSIPPITFTSKDFQNIDPNQDDPMVITVEVAGFVVMKTLVDQGSFV